MSAGFERTHTSVNRDYVWRGDGIGGRLGNGDDYRIGFSGVTLYISVLFRIIFTVTLFHAFL